jgi:hypothetical protein
MTTLNSKKILNFSFCSFFSVQTFGSTLGHTKKNVVFPLTLWKKKNRVGGLEINFNFFLNSISNSSEYIANSNTVMTIFIELNKDFTFCIHRASVHMQNCSYLCTGCKYKDAFYIFWNKLDFCLKGSIKFLGSGLKFTVGRVCRKAFFFFFCMALCTKIKYLNFIIKI